MGRDTETTYGAVLSDRLNEDSRVEFNKLQNKKDTSGLTLKEEARYAQLRFFVTLGMEAEIRQSLRPMNLAEDKPIPSCCAAGKCGTPECGCKGEHK